MNKKIKRKLVKKIDRKLANKACQFFVHGNPKLKKVFKFRLRQFRLWQFTHIGGIDIDDWTLLQPNK